MAIIRGPAMEFAKRHMPKEKVQTHLMYKELVINNVLASTLEPPTLQEKKRLINQWLCGVYREQGEHSPMLSNINLALKTPEFHEADLSWLEQLDTAMLYTAWLLLVRTSVMFHSESSFTVHRLTPRDWRDEKGQMVEGQLVINQEYLNVGLDQTPLSKEKISQCLLEFFIASNQRTDVKKQILGSLRSGIQMAKSCQWFAFAKGDTEEKLDWLWSYLKKELSLPYLISERMTAFRWERIFAEFALVERAPNVKLEEHEKAKKAYSNSVRVKSDGKKARINLTLDLEAKSLLTDMAGGPRQQSQLVQELIYQEAANRGLSK